MPSDKTNLAALKRGAIPLSRDGEWPANEPHIRFTVDLPESDHLYLRLMSAENRLSMSDIVRASVKLMREHDDVADNVKRRARSL